MFSTLCQKWFRRPPQYVRRRPPAPKRCRPRLEWLEERCVPSTVTNLSDHDPGSLRDAIASTPSGGTVNFQPGLTGTITLTTGELAITKNLAIAGPGASAITVSGDHASRVFDIAASFTVNISGLTIADGEMIGFDAPGGGILNAGTLTLANSTLSGNSATIGQGGGIYNSGTLTVTSSTLSGNGAGATNGDAAGGGIYNIGMLTLVSSILSRNAATGFSTILRGAGTGRGGGIYNGGTLIVTNSTLSGSSATGAGAGFGRGGGIYNSGTLTVTNSTLSGSSATGGRLGGNGGGIYNSGTLTVTNSTLSGNSATSTILGSNSAGGGMVNSGMLTVTNSTLSGNSATTGGGIFSALVAVSSRNTIIAGNSAPSTPDVAGPLTSQGHNLIGDGTGGSGFIASDLVGTSSNPIDPKLGPLQNNGGPTQTMALLPGSPAIDAGDNAFSPGPYDQRGPGFPRIANGIIDIGAFEVQAVPLTVQCSVTTPVLAPPNHQLVNVGLSVQVSDPSATVTVQVFANDGALSADAADFAPGQLRLRGERRGGGSGRVYLIVVQATDAAGAVAVSVCTVVVPHDRSPDALAAVEQQAADAAAYFQAFQTAPSGYRRLG